MYRSKGWSIRNYNAAIKALKASGASHREAQRAYSGIRGRLGRPLFGVDIQRHPRIAKQEIAKAIEQLEEEKSVQDILDSEKYESEGSEADYYGYDDAGYAESRVSSLDVWEENYDDWIDDEGEVVDEHDGTADYAEAP